jgi:lipoprotein-anchoring transpeptidase ErfK/SrfK
VLFGWAIVTDDLTLALRVVQDNIKAGRKGNARELLQALANQYPKDVRIWLWLAALATSEQESLDYIGQAKRIAPDDARVLKAEAWANERSIAVPDETPLAAEAPIPPPIPIQKTQPPPISAVTQERPKQPAPKSNRLFRFAVVFLLVLFLIVATSLVYVFVRASSDNDPEEVTGALIATDDIALNTGIDSPVQVAPTMTPTTEPTPSPAPTLVEIEAEPTKVPERAILIRPKNVLMSFAGTVPTWTPTPRPTDTPTPSPTPYPTFVSDPSAAAASRPLGLARDEKWIDVDITSQSLVAYEGDFPVFDSLVSTGTNDHPTVTGQFRIWLRFRSQDMDGYRLGYDYFLRNVPFVQYFYYDYSLHGTFWHNNFGNPMSHGCVNLPTPAAEWLFDWAEHGTLVNIHY